MWECIWRPRSTGHIKAPDTSKPTRGLTFSRNFTHDGPLHGGWGGDITHGRGEDASQLRAEVNRVVSKVTNPEETGAAGAAGEHGSALASTRGSGSSETGEGQMQEIKELLHFGPKQHSLPVEKLGGSPKRA